MTNLAVGPDPEAEWLRRQIAAFEGRLKSLEPTARPQAAVQQEPLPRLAPPPPPTAASQIPLAPAPPWRAPGAPHVATTPRSHTRRTTSMSVPGMEVLLKWSGLILLFLSALFLVSTAIQRGWIGPELQLVGAAAIGFTLIGGGAVLGARLPGWDTPLMAMGIAILAASAAAGWAWLSLGSHEPWMAVSFAVLILSIGLTIRLGRPGVAATGLVTTLIGLSFLASSLAQLAIVAALGIVTVDWASVWRQLSSLHVITVVAGLLTFGGIAIAAGFENDPVSLNVLVAGATVTLTFWVMPLLFTLRPPVRSTSGLNWCPTIDRISASLPALFGTAWVLSMGTTGQEAGTPFFWTGSLALVSTGLVAAHGRFAPTVWISQALGGMAALTIGWVSIFDGPALLAGLALQAAALLVFIEFVADPWARLQAWGLATLAGLVAFMGMAEAIDSGHPIIDDAVHLGVVGLAGVWAFWLLRRSEDDQLGRFVAGTAYAGAAFWPISALIHVSQGQALISAAWAVLGFAALALGFARSSQRVAWVGFATLAVVMVKLLTIDLAAVDTFVRVALFFVLGGAFLFSSFRMGTALQSLTTADDLDANHDGVGSVGPSKPQDPRFV